MMNFKKLLNEWSMQTPQVVTLGTTSMYYLGLFVEFLEAKQNEQNVYVADNICPDCKEPLKSHNQAGGKFFCKPSRPK